MFLLIDLARADVVFLSFFFFFQSAGSNRTHTHKETTVLRFHSYIVFCFFDRAKNLKTNKTMTKISRYQLFLFLYIFDFIFVVVVLISWSSQYDVREFARYLMLQQKKVVMILFSHLLTKLMRSVLLKQYNYYYY